MYCRLDSASANIFYKAISTVEIQANTMAKSSKTDSHIIITLLSGINIFMTFTYFNKKSLNCIIAVTFSSFGT